MRNTTIAQIAVILLSGILYGFADEIENRPHRFTKEAPGENFLFERLNPQIVALMKENNVPGLSFAIIEDYKVIYTKEFGVKEYGKKDEIDQNTAFSLASMSKAITATVCGILAEQGKLDLDVPVRDYLKRFTLPESEYFKNTDITLRHLLSHTAGTNHIRGYADFYLGDDIPTPLQVLHGELLPRYPNQGLEILFEPGTDTQYGGAGYTLVQIILEDVLDKPFKDLVHDMLFEPLRMNHTTLVQPNEQEFSINTAKVHNHRKEVIRTGLPICPQLPASGVWSTPSDLAFFGIELQKALNGKQTKVISKNVAEEVTKIQTGQMRQNQYALGWQKVHGYGNRNWIVSDGSNTGVNTIMELTEEDGNGFIVMANGGDERPITNFLIQILIEELEWKREIKEPLLDLEKEVANSITGYYSDFIFNVRKNDIIEVFLKEDQLYCRNLEDRIHVLFGKEEAYRMYPIGEGLFRVENNPNYVSFDIHDKEVVGVTVYRGSSQNEKVIIESLDLFSLTTNVLNISKSEDSLGLIKEEILKFESKLSKKELFDELNELPYSLIAENKPDLALELTKFGNQRYTENLYSYEILAELLTDRKEFKKAIIVGEEYYDKLEDKATKKKVKSWLKYFKSQI